MLGVFTGCNITCTAATTHFGIALAPQMPFSLLIVFSAWELCISMQFMPAYFSVVMHAGVFSFCFAGHAVFVSPLYTSMAKPKEYGNMLRVSFLAALLLYVTMAVLGVAAFGRNVRSVAL